MLHKDQPDVVLLHVGSNDINNQTKDKINTEKLTILSTLINFASILERCYAFRGFRHKYSSR